MERAFVGLFRWYVDRSQTTRNWNPDRSFDWKNMRQDHSPEVMQILEGFFAVEQYIPDYSICGAMLCSLVDSGHWTGWRITLIN